MTSGKRPSTERLENWTAAGQGARTAIVAFGGFALGYWGCDRLQIAVFATFGGLALTGIANFGGTMRGRFTANAVAGVTGVGLASLGTWASSEPVGAAAVVTFGVGLAVVLFGLFGGYFAVASSAVLLYYLVAVGSPTPIAAIPDRLYGVLIGAALAAVASVTLWPEKAGPRLLAVLAVRVRQLGEALLSPGLMTTPMGASSGIRAVVDVSADRPAGPTRTQRAALYLLNDLERLEHLVRRAAQTELPAGEREVLARSGQKLLQVACTLNRPSTPGPAEETSGSGERFGIAYRVHAVTEAIAAHAAAATGAAPNSRDGLSVRYVSPVLHGALRLRANLSMKSVQLQDSVRTGAALAIAYLLAREFALQHGFWVELATLTVVRSGAATTTRSVGQAIAGTIIGVAVGFAVITAAGTDIAAYAAITPIAIASAIYLRAAINFLAGQAGFTVSVLLLFSLLGPAGWHIGIVRLEDVLVGAAAGLATSVIAWPRGSVAAIGPAAADLISLSFDYLRTAVRSVVTPPPPGAESDALGAARRTALSAMLRAEAAYSQLIAERSDQRATVEWAPIMAAGNRLWYAADLISADLISADLISAGGPVPAPDREAVNRAIRRVESVTRQAYEGLRNRTPGTNSLASSTPVATGTTDPLALWIEDLASQLAGLSIPRET